MPYVNLRIAGEATKEQKQEIAERFSQTLLDVLGKPKESTYLVIDEVPRTHWAKGDKFLA